ncbi:hypothetical protein COO55_09865 [Rhodococcus opacus]|nr:hypothetical protein COO55_09865 [Rhodococcus opacus]
MAAGGPARRLPDLTTNPAVPCGPTPDPSFTTTTLPVATVAVDLMDSLDTRERSAGVRAPGELLDDIR